MGIGRGIYNPQPSEIRPCCVCVCICVYTIEFPLLSWSTAIKTSFSSLLSFLSSSSSKRYIQKKKKRHLKINQKKKKTRRSAGKMPPYLPRYLPTSKEVPLPSVRILQRVCTVLTYHYIYILTYTPYILYIISLLLISSPFKFHHHPHQHQHEIWKKKSFHTSCVFLLGWGGKNEHGKNDFLFD